MNTKKLSELMKQVSSTNRMIASRKNSAGIHGTKKYKRHEKHKSSQVVE